MVPSLCGACAERQDGPDGARVARPRLGLGQEEAAAGGGEPVVARLAVVLGDAPARAHELALLEAVERLVQRAVVDGEPAAGGAFEPARDAEAVHLVPAEGLEDQEVER